MLRKVSSEHLRSILLLSLRPFGILFYASPIFWVRLHAESMHRLTAKLLLLFALVGYLAPVAMASAAAPHACCLRKGIHHCQDSLGSETGQPVIHVTSCCNGDCCRAVTTEQWAHAQAPAATSFVQNVEAYLGQSTPVSPNAEVSSFQSTRAPPAC
jgi:hypothetical protein